MQGFRVPLARARRQEAGDIYTLRPLTLALRAQTLHLRPYLIDDLNGADFLLNHDLHHVSGHVGLRIELDDGTVERRLLFLVLTTQQQNTHTRKHANTRRRVKPHASRCLGSQYEKCPCCLRSDRYVLYDTSSSASD